MSDTTEEMKKLEKTREDLKQLESDIKAKASEVDESLANLKEQEDALDQKEEAFNKKLGILDASSVFDDMVKTVNKLYSSYYGIKGTDEGLMEAIQSILNARQSINR